MLEEITGEKNRNPDMEIKGGAQRCGLMCSEKYCDLTRFLLLSSS